LIAENERRKERLSVIPDPVTGKDCTGKRVHLHISDAPFTDLYLPEEMTAEPACILLGQHGSIRGVFEDGGEECTKEAYTDFWVRFCELRMKYDFEYYCISQITIKDKNSSVIIPFRLNRPQRERLLPALEHMRLKGIPIRLNYLKARQVGGSTLIQIYMNWIQIFHRKNWNSVVCAHLKESALRIRNMYEDAIKGMFPVNGVRLTVRSFQRTQNIKYVPERGCLITVCTAEKPDAIRSDDVKMVHLSEMALYPNTAQNNPELIEAAILGTIPNVPLSLVVRETTARGTVSYFYEHWTKAARGETVFENVFVPWYVADIYSVPFNGTYHQHNGKLKDGSVEDFVRSMSEYELNAFRNHPGCTLENLNWRRLTAATMPSERYMKQEYPLDDIEAFQDSGASVFRAEDIEAMRHRCKLPKAAGTLAADCDPAIAAMFPHRRKEVLKGIRFVPDAEALEDIRSGGQFAEIKERNRLLVWEFPDTSERVKDRYIVVFDPQKGLSESADFGVIAVIDRYWMMYGGKPEIVAQWRGRVDKDVAVWIGAQIATWFCNALFIVESNTYDSDIKDDDSEFVFDTLADCYRNLYSRTPAGKVREGIPVRYGFHTNRTTKPMLINNYNAMLREQGYVERHREALNEARVYEQKPDGKYGAKDGRHDDIVMTRMIGLHVCYNEMPLPQLMPDKGTFIPRPLTGEADM
jgi:hypothetical protein